MKGLIFPSYEGTQRNDLLPVFGGAIYSRVAPRRRQGGENVAARSAEKETLRPSPRRGRGDKNVAALSAEK